jgi:hypothetical protein
MTCARSLDSMLVLCSPILVPLESMQVSALSERIMSHAARVTGISALFH